MKLFNNFLPDIWRLIPTAWAVLISALIITWWSWFLVKEANYQRVKENVFDYRVTNIKHAILNRMFVYQQVLEGAVGLFAVSAAIQRDEWHNYVQSLQLEKNYPGVRGIGFVKHLRPDEKANHIAEIRAEGGFFQNYTLTPAGEREEYATVVYIEPMDERNQRVLGFDMFAESVRRAALERARDTGEPALSGKVTLVQETNEDVQAGCFLSIPIYRHGIIPDTIAKRRAALVGYVSSTFRMNDLMRGILGKQQSELDFEIYDSNDIHDFSPNKRLYDEVTEHLIKNGESNSPSRFRTVAQLDIAGHTWTLHFATLPQFDIATKTYSSDIVLWSGIVISFLLFGMVRLLETTRLLAIQRKNNVRLQQEIEERQRITLALRASEERFELAMRGSNDGVWDWDLTTNTVYHSPRFKQLLGYEGDEVISFDTSLLHVHPEDAPRLTAQLAAYLERKTPNYEHIIRVRHQQGHYLWIMTRATAVWDADGKPVRMVGTHTDLTALHVAKEALRKSEEKYRQIVETAQEGIWIIDAQAKTTYVNAKMAQMLGYSETEMLGKSLLDFMDDTVQQQALQNFERRCQGISEVHDFRFQRKDGSDLWAIVSTNAILDSAGCFIGSLGMITDITQRKQAEMALDNQRNTLQVILDNMPAGIHVHEPNNDQKIILANRYGEYLLNKPTPYEAALDQLTNIYGTFRYGTDELYPVEQMPLTRALAGEIAMVEDLEVRRTDGTRILLQAIAAPIRDQTGKITAGVVIFFDITERKKMELDLRQAKEQAEIANRAKSTFLAKMSHELRTPLNGILGYAQILSRADNLTKEQTEGLHVIERSGDYLLTLINDILDLAKVEAGKVELSPTVVPLEEFLRGVEQLFQMRAKQKGIQFSYQPLSELPMAIAVDETRLRQVLINLLGNAFKFTEQGKVTLTVKHTKGELCFQVSDQGCGIAAADLDKLFLPFQQVGDKKYWGQGTGLGLPITKKLVEMMGGNLQVTSTLGQGSSFSVFLPLSEVPNLLHSTGDTKLPKILGYQGRPRTVLVIDDNLVNRTVLVKLLTSLGFTTLEAVDGQDGLKQAQEIPSIDLILMDLVMPDLDGFAVIPQVKQMPQCRDTVLIAVSASAFEEDRQKSLELGCQDFIAKPFKFEEFLERLRVHLNLTWLYEETTVVSTSPEESTVPIEVPPAALTSTQVAELLDLAYMGDVQNILEYTEKLANTDEALATFARYLHQLAEQFEFEKICEILQK